LPRVGGGAPIALATALVVAHVWWSLALVKRSDEFTFLNDFSRSAAAWLYTVGSLTELRPVDEVVVPRDGLTDLVFDVGEAHRLFLCARYRVRTAPQFDSQSQQPGRLLVRQAVPFAQVPRSWAWMKQACAHQARH